MSDDNRWEQPEAPPPTLFLGQPEKDFVKQISDEIMERVVGQNIMYYPIDMDNTYYHPLYKEAINKTYLPPINVYVLVKFEEMAKGNKFGIERQQKLTVFFHKRRLHEDQELYVRAGDFVKYGDNYYEITTLVEPKEIFGDTYSKLEIAANCIKAREGLFDGE